MSKVQLYLPQDVAHATVEELGHLGLFEAIDLNPDVNPFQRNYVADIRRLDEMERRLRFLTEEIHDAAVPVSLPCQLLAVTSDLQADDDGSVRICSSAHSRRLASSWNNAQAVNWWMSSNRASSRTRSVSASSATTGTISDKELWS